MEPYPMDFVRFCQQLGFPAAVLVALLYLLVRAGRWLAGVLEPLAEKVGNRIVAFLDKVEALAQQGADTGARIEAKLELTRAELQLLRAHIASCPVNNSPFNSLNLPSSGKNP